MGLFGKEADVTVLDLEDEAGERPQSVGERGEATVRGLRDPLVDEPGRDVGGDDLELTRIGEAITMNGFEVGVGWRGGDRLPENLSGKPPRPLIAAPVFWRLRARPPPPPAA